MCGFAGVLTRGPRSLESLVAISQSMASAVANRGPDAAGVWCDAEAGVALAHRRLAVIDRSEDGRQPMTSQDGRYVLAFNGEIYNHRAMRQELPEGGSRLRGHSDTEILLETIAGSSLEEGLSRANGMFALALWDRHERTLMLARDRMGEKPLYYGWIGEDLAFASQLTALQRHRNFRAGLDLDAVGQFLRNSFIPGPATVYEGVHKLQPGHVLTVNAVGHRDSATLKQYWSLSDVAAAGQANVMPDGDATVLDRAETLLLDSVESRMIADVPLGAFLSGGVDSSLVVALMQRVSTSPVRTFTVAVGGSYDESGQAAEVARHLGTDHTRIDLSEAEALDLVSRLPDLYDEPFADPSALPTALVAAAARSEVTVCLTGDGGDELLAGYNRYLVADRAFRIAGRMWAPARRRVARGLEAWSPDRWSLLGQALLRDRAIPDIGTKLHKLAQVLEADGPNEAFRALTICNRVDRLMLGHAAREDSREFEEEPKGLDPLHRMLFHDCATTLPDDMLVKVDRASMAVALECRVPFLDHRFVELVWCLPGRVKRRSGGGKWLLRQLARRHVPGSLIDRPKQGFDPPLADWLRGPLRMWMCDTLSRSRLERDGLLDARQVERLIDEHIAGVRNHDYALWTLLMFHGWSDRQSFTPVPLVSSG